MAKSKIVSWHTGRFSNSNVNELRELTTGSNLFGLTNYWNEVARKKSATYCVILLGDESWLDELIYPSVPTYGNSWIYLDTLEKKIKWLSVKYEPPVVHSEGRNIPPRLRFRVLRRDKFTCQGCGAKAPGVELEIDHIVPWSDVKEHKIENLQVLCKDCNRGKSNLPWNE